MKETQRYVTYLVADQEQTRSVGTGRKSSVKISLCDSRVPGCRLQGDQRPHDLSVS
jgi:hypothetical protein